MADKQAALVDAIATGVKDKMSPEFKALADTLAKLTVTNNASLARLEVVESMLASGTTTAKKAVRTGAAASKKGATVGKKAAAGFEESKVKNTLLYFRHAMANNLDGLRDIYGTEENLAEAESDSSVSKKDRNKDEAGYFSAVGHFLWKATLTDEQKAEVKTLFTTWQAQNKQNEDQPQLDEDDGDNAEADS